MKPLLQIKNLHAKIGQKEILKGIDLVIKSGEIHVVMGPNGSGKSTLANVLMGNPRFEVTKGTVALDGKNILEMEPEERATAGIFMAFQYPREISGVHFNNFLFTAYSNIQKAKNPEVKLPTVFEFKELLEEKAKKLKLQKELIERSVNEGFSGGEKKKAEMLQLAVLNPLLAILDETDSGLDVDALKIVGKGIKNFSTPKNSSLIVTHYNRILNYITPDIVHVIIDGRIVKSGDKNLAVELEEKGYEQFV